MGGLHPTPGLLTRTNSVTITFARIRLVFVMFGAQTALQFKVHTCAHALIAPSILMGIKLSATALTQFRKALVGVRGRHSCETALTHISNLIHDSEEIGNAGNRRPDPYACAVLMQSFSSRHALSNWVARCIGPEDCTPGASSYVQLRCAMFVEWLGLAGTELDFEKLGRRCQGS